MDEKYEIGQFGEATFIAKTGFKYPIICYGIITGIESKIISFTDNDGNEYLIPKNKFKFEKKVFVNLNLQ
jgi:hypothetical protein